MSKRASSSGDLDGNRLKAYFYVVAPLVLGLCLVLSSGIYRWGLAQKAERLRADGVAVTATVANFHSGGSGRGSGPDWVDLVYVFNGREYQSRVRCGNLNGCEEPPESQITIRVDPDDPSQALTMDGNVTGSLSWLSSWTLIPAGVVLVLGGGAGTAFVLTHDGKVRAWLRKWRQRGSRPT